MTAPRHITIADVKVGNDLPLVMIAGPCVMESRSHALDMSGALAEMAKNLGIGLIYKTSFDKANRTSATGERGLGLDAALQVFADIRKETGLPVLTDVHEAGHCAAVADAEPVRGYLDDQEPLTYGLVSRWDGPRENPDGDVVWLSMRAPRESASTLIMDTHGHLVPGQEADAVARMRDMMTPADAQQATGTDDSTVLLETGAQHWAQQSGRETLRPVAARIANVRGESDAASPVALST